MEGTAVSSDAFLDNDFSISAGDLAEKRKGAAVARIVPAPRQCPGASSFAPDAVTSPPTNDPSRYRHGSSGGGWENGSGWRDRYFYRLGIVEDHAETRARSFPAPLPPDDRIGGGAPFLARQVSPNEGDWKRVLGTNRGADAPSSFSSSDGFGISWDALGGGKPSFGNDISGRLLRSSTHYTLELKYDASDPTDVEKASSSPSNGARKIISNDGNDSPSPPSPKFELSSAWTSLLSKSDATPALDGAFDLFSLPSDASFRRASPPSVGVTGGPPNDPASLASSSVSLGSSLCRTSSRSLFDRRESRDGSSSSENFRPLPSSSRRGQGPRRNRERIVSFLPSVSAVTIPSRSDYSSRTFVRLWTTHDDIHTNAIRNELEYAFDGGDWRSAREEGGFVLCRSVDRRCCASSFDAERVKKELVHPVHFTEWSNPGTLSPPLMTHLHPPPPDGFPWESERENTSAMDEDGDEDISSVFFAMDMSMD